MAEYNFREIEKKWRDYWKENKTFNKEISQDKPKYYVIDMFAYPSGEGLHVGHPLGYIATDIIARYKKLKGYNVLHPMGFDAFGLPTEQYAIETGQHPEDITLKNTKRYIEQLERIGLVYDLDTHFNTSDKEYYKWTQWIFLKLFDSWFDKSCNRARPIADLIFLFTKEGNSDVNAHTDQTQRFDNHDWQGYTLKEREIILNKYRLMFISETVVNWCPDLNTVLSNDEVVNGVSERGGFPIVRKPMKQWSMRMTAYADRLLEGLQKIEFPDSIKEMQTNWIGKSEGMLFRFKIVDSNDVETLSDISVFTTRPETIFGVTFLVIAPEHSFTREISTGNKVVKDYVDYALNRSDLERIAEVKTITGVFTQRYVIHPFTKEKIPIWISDYVLGSYGTGTIMGVPAHDARDFLFATHFNLPIREIISHHNSNFPLEPYQQKEGLLVDSGFLNGKTVKEASEFLRNEIQPEIGSPKTMYRLKDPNFSRQRYWGEPIPIVYNKEQIPSPLPNEELPLELPRLSDISSGGEGVSPLVRDEKWITYSESFIRENHTMPGYAGSSWYFFRYIDPKNNASFISKELDAYWMNVDLYIGGAEHAVGHLLYSRFWTKVLFDLGYTCKDEPFQKLINQGMIQGRSSLIYRIKGTNKFVSHGLIGTNEVDELHVPIKAVQNDILNIEKLKELRKDYADASFILENGNYRCGSRIEKMSKRWYNVINPDEICEEYGADTFRCYEMFLGPLTESKPFTIEGIIGVFKFLKRTLNLYIDENNTVKLIDIEPTNYELKILHQTIKKVEEAIVTYSFNTAISQMMIFCNEMTKLQCNKRQVLEKFIIILAPFAPHLAEELWEKIGNKIPVSNANWVNLEEEYLKEDVYEYVVQINGKLKLNLMFSATALEDEIKSQVLSNSKIQHLIGDKKIIRIVFVRNKIVNIVLN